jgi:hypothetical protein
VKGRVGQQYSNETTLQIIHDRLSKEFRMLENNCNAVIEMIEKCAAYEKEFHAKIGAKEKLNKMGMTMMTTPLPLKFLEPMLRMGMTSNLS